MRFFVGVSVIILGCIISISSFAKESNFKVSNNAQENYQNGVNYQDWFAKQPGVHKTASGLLYKIIKPGKKGTKPKSSGDFVTVHYVGKLIDGNIFDSSYKSHKPATFALSQVIAGWTEGLKLIGEGGQILLVIPPQLGYGSQKISTIPANSTLIFDVKLLEVFSVQ